MELKFKQKFDLSGDTLLRKCGYAQFLDPNTEKFSYVRRMGQHFYPRFHCYINGEDPLVISLHLDQKHVSYEGQRAHSGDYDSDLVKNELTRMANIISGLSV